MTDFSAEHGIFHSRSQGLIDAAYNFAKRMHGEQKRKYTGAPYITHPVAVAKLVATVTYDCEMICAALLHDVIEDTPATFDDICAAGFGPSIGRLVLELTDISKPEDGNRAARKAIDRAHIAHASPRGKTVKLADLIDNTESICRYDPNFARVYMAEKRKLLAVLSDGDSALFNRAIQLVEDYYSR